MGIAAADFLQKKELQIVKNIWDVASDESLKGKKQYLEANKMLLDKILANKSQTQVEYTMQSPFESIVERIRGLRPIKEIREMKEMKEIEEIVDK